MVTLQQGLNVCGMSLLRTSIVFCGVRGILPPLFFVACTSTGTLGVCKVKSSNSNNTKVSRGQVHSLSSSNSFFREKAKSSYPKVLTNSLAEEVDKRPPNGGCSLHTAQVSVTWSSRLSGIQRLLKY